MRGTLERDTQVAVDQNNTPGPPSWAVQVLALPCYVYEKARPTRYIDGNKTATVSDLVAMVPKGTDIKAGDRFNGVVDRLGAVIHATPLKIQGVPRRAAWGHIEAILEDSST